MSAPTSKQLARMEWGRKAIRADLHTGGEHRPLISWPVQTGGWVTQDGPNNGEACGQGLHAALTVAGMSSAHRLTESVCCVVGWLPEDVLGRDTQKVRAKRLYVAPGAVGFPTVLRSGWGTGAYLSWANLSGADLSGADLSGANLSWANLSGANLTGAHADRWTRLPDGYRVDGNRIVAA